MQKRKIIIDCDPGHDDAILLAAGNPSIDLLAFFGNTYREVNRFEAPPVHDACCVAYVIDPNVFTTRHMFVDVECKGELTYGRTVCDLPGEA